MRSVAGLPDKMQASERGHKQVISLGTRMVSSYHHAQGIPSPSSISHHTY
jgi:hypothetical protein